MKKNNEKMSDLTAAAITVGGIGIVLALGIGVLSTPLILGLGGVTVVGSIGLCIKGKKNG